MSRRTSSTDLYCKKFVHQLPPSQQIIRERLAIPNAISFSAKLDAALSISISPCLSSLSICSSARPFDAKARLSSCVDFGLASAGCTDLDFAVGFRGAGGGCGMVGVAGEAVEGHFQPELMIAERPFETAFTERIASAHVSSFDLFFTGVEGGSSSSRSVNFVASWVARSEAVGILDFDVEGILEVRGAVVRPAAGARCFPLTSARASLVARVEASSSGVSVVAVGFDLEALVVVVFCTVVAVAVVVVVAVRVEGCLRGAMVQAKFQLETRRVLQGRDVSGDRSVWTCLDIKRSVFLFLLATLTLRVAACQKTKIPARDSIKTVRLVALAWHEDILKTGICTHRSYRMTR